MPACCGSALLLLSVQSLLDVGRGRYKRVQLSSSRPGLGEFKVQLSEALQIGDEGKVRCAIPLRSQDCQVVTSLSIFLLNASGAVLFSAGLQDFDLVGG